MALTPALFRSAVADGGDATKLRPSSWNAISDLLSRVFSGVTSGILYFLVDGIGIGTGVPTPTTQIKSIYTNDGQTRVHLENQSAGINAYADLVLKTNTTAAYMGSSSPNYGADGLGANRSWLDTSTTAGCGWDFSAPAAGGNHRWYTDGYSNLNLRATLDKNGYAAVSLRSFAVTFANRPATAVEGMLVTFTDSTVSAYGATIAGGGANHVLGYYTGAIWIVK